MPDSEYGKKKWTWIQSYAGGLDVPLNFDGINPRLIQPTIDFHKSFENLRDTLANRERQLIKLKQLGLKSSRHE